LTNKYVSGPKSAGKPKWNLEEKIQLVATITSDKRFTPTERAVAVAMISYFHNTTSGDLFPSLEQVAERCHCKKDRVISAIKKMERFAPPPFLSLTRRA
jgi:hypothetical protein